MSGIRDTCKVAKNHFKKCFIQKKNSVLFLFKYFPFYFVMTNNSALYLISRNDWKRSSYKISDFVRV